MYEKRYCLDLLLSYAVLVLLLFAVVVTHHELSGQAAHERSGHPAVNPISAESHGLW